jgi:hypothetical protein
MWTDLHVARGGYEGLWCMGEGLWCMGRTAKQKLLGHGAIPLYCFQVNAYGQ